MKKKFFRILGVTVTLALVFSLGALPVAASSTVTVTPPDGSTISGIETLVVDYDGPETPIQLEIDIPTPTVYKHLPDFVLGQEKAPLLPCTFPAYFTADADPTEDWTSDEREIARELGFISAAYDADDKEWTIVIDTLKKCEVGDSWLIGGGWWPGQEVWFDGGYTLTFTVRWDGSESLFGVDYLFDNEECITPELGLNAKGAQQKFWLNYIDVVDGEPVGHMFGDTGGWFWAFVPGINLSTWGPPGSPFDVIVLAGGRPYTDSWGECHGCFHSASGTCLPDRFIEIWSRAPELGDCEIKVYTCSLTSSPDCCTDEVGEEVASAEKKWGELHHSELDVILLPPPPPFLPPPLPYPPRLAPIDHQDGVDTDVKKILKEKVWCSFPQLTEPGPAGGALVHWWLARETHENQLWIYDLMHEIVARAGAEGFYGSEPGPDENDYWSATGKYDAAEHPKDIIDAWIYDPIHPRYATETDWVALNPEGSIGGVSDTYAQNLTMDYLPGEDPGVAQATLVNDGDEEDVLIITLVEYQENYNAQNLILIQIALDVKGVMLKFIADKTQLEVGEEVTFTNLTTEGVTPYTRAEWDVDGDGTPEIILDVTFDDDPTTRWDDSDPMADVTWAYDAPGTYGVILTMTDSTRITRWEARPDYITVTPVEGEDILAYYRAYSGDPLVADLADVVQAANDCVNGVTPPGFAAVITLEQLVQLANEWLGL